jgi:hypothetical protein
VVQTLSSGFLCTVFGTFNTDRLTNARKANPLAIALRVALPQTDTTRPNSRAYLHRDRTKYTVPTFPLTQCDLSALREFRDPVETCPQLDRLSELDSCRDCGCRLRRSQRVTASVRLVRFWDRLPKGNSLFACVVRRSYLRHNELSYRVIRLPKYSHEFSACEIEPLPCSKQLQPYVHFQAPMLWL